METRGAGGRTGERADTGIPLWWAHRKHGSNLWYENGWWRCLFPWKGYGECRNRVLDFCTTVWFVSIPNAAGPAHLCHSFTPVVSKIQMKLGVRLQMPVWRSPVVLSHWSCSAGASEDRSCPICSVACGLLQPLCLRVWGPVTLMGPLHSFSVTHSPHKSLLFSSPDGQFLPEDFQLSFSCEGEGSHLRHCPCAPQGLCSGEGCAGFHTKQPCCNTASFKSTQQVPHGLGAVSQEKCPLFAPLPGTSCIWRGQNWLQMVGGLGLVEGH